MQKKMKKKGGRSTLQAVLGHFEPLRKLNPLRISTYGFKKNQIFSKSRMNCESRVNMFDKKGNPWYRVSAFDQRKKQIGTGWINSMALLNQKLKAYK
ncbi:MAG: hypothetical protein ACE5H1_06480 [Thermodesulfobacteriota bacterium]